MTSSNLPHKAFAGLRPVLAMALLASCGSPADTPQAPDTLRSGLWELTETVDSIEGPDIPPEAIDGLKAKWVRPTHRSCLMPDQVEKPPQEFFSEAAGSCSYQRFSMKHGKIDATIDCPRNDGTHVVEIAGTVKPESLRLNVNHILDSPNKSQRMAVNTSMEGKRVGEC